MRGTRTAGAPPETRSTICVLTERAFVAIVRYMDSMENNATCEICEKPMRPNGHGCHAGCARKAQRDWLRRVNPCLGFESFPFARDEGSKNKRLMNHDAAKAAETFARTGESGLTIE